MLESNMEEWSCDCLDLEYEELSLVIMIVIRV